MRKPWPTATGLRILERELFATLCCQAASAAEIAQRMPAASVDTSLRVKERERHERQEIEHGDDARSLWSTELAEKPIVKMPLHAMYTV